MLPGLFSGNLYGYGFGVGYANAAADARIAAEDQVMPVDIRLQHLELACAGLWDLLKTKLNCTDDELIEAIHKVDGSDGRIDGHVGLAVDAVCPKCHRKLLTRSSPNCAWCGAPLYADPFKRI